LLQVDRRDDRLDGSGRYCVVEDEQERLPFETVEQVQQRKRLADDHRNIDGSAEVMSGPLPMPHVVYGDEARNWVLP
jgi:hypothetical protein